MPVLVLLLVTVLLAAGVPMVGSEFSTALSLPEWVVPADRTVR